MNREMFNAMAVFLGAFPKMFDILNYTDYKEVIFYESNHQEGQRQRSVYAHMYHKPDDGLPIIHYYYEKTEISQELFEDMVVRKLIYYYNTVELVMIGREQFAGKNKFIATFQPGLSGDKTLVYMKGMYPSAIFAFMTLVVSNPFIDAVEDNMDNEVIKGHLSKMYDQKRLAQYSSMKHITGFVLDIEETVGSHVILKPMSGPPESVELN